MKPNLESAQSTAVHANEQPELTSCRFKEDVPHLSRSSIANFTALGANVVMAVEASTASWTVFNAEDTVLITDKGFEHLSTIDRGTHAS